MHHRCFSFIRSTFAVILTLGLAAAPALAHNPYGAPPPVVAFGAAHFDAINACNAKAGGTGCTSHVVFSTTPDELCGAVAVRHSAQGALIGSATAGNQRDAEARALMKAGTGASILAYGCNTP